MNEIIQAIASRNLYMDKDMMKAERITKINFNKEPDIDKEDQLFASRKKCEDFSFGDKTGAVFDDMVNRSVPYYSEIQRMTCEIARSFAVPGTNIYDVGCATGTTLHGLDELIDPKVHFIGIDNSENMLARAKSKLKRTDSHRKIDFINADLNGPPQFKDASIVIMLLTLQFVRPLNRVKLI